MPENRLTVYGWIPLWLVLVITALLCRPPLPIDETRYLSVAWEMWQNHQFLVPHINGLPYSHKPPLLF
ncbi:MAG TPA: glycosyltransferase, partial [Desulfobulbus sp.]|nr:glycosyltransferase [Desulfobulbus sp.]